MTAPAFDTDEFCLWPLLIALLEANTTDSLFDVGLRIVPMLIRSFSDGGRSDVLLMIAPRSDRVQIQGCSEVWLRFV